MTWPGFFTIIRDACGHRRAGDPAPKSQRVWRKSENEVLPMGWMRIGGEKRTPYKNLF